MDATLHMVTSIIPDALSIAANLDAERCNGTNRGYERDPCVASA
jgi:hypothetical protein